MAEWRITFGMAASMAALLSWGMWHTMMDPFFGRVPDFGLQMALPLYVLLACYLLLETALRWKKMSELERSIGVSALAMQAPILLLVWTKL